MAIAQPREIAERSAREATWAEPVTDVAQERGSARLERGVAGRKTAVIRVVSPTRPPLAR